MISHNFWIWNEPEGEISNRGCLFHLKTIFRSVIDLTYRGNKCYDVSIYPFFLLVCGCVDETAHPLCLVQIHSGVEQLVIVIVFVFPLLHNRIQVLSETHEPWSHTCTNVSVEVRQKNKNITDRVVFSTVWLVVTFHKATQNIWMFIQNDLLLSMFIALDQYLEKGIIINNNSSSHVYLNCSPLNW